MFERETTDDKSENYSAKNKTAKVVKRFAFNPNTVTKEDLMALGLKEKTAGIFLKFRSKGFVFRKKEDLKKVYGISEKQYAELEPYIVIETETPKEKEKMNVAAEKKATVITELNSADSLALLEINGIGPAFAKRILKYRSLLGGFISTEQLKEVYGFTEEMFEKVGPQVKADATSIKKLDLNKDDFKTINKHPYLSYELTKLIFNARRGGAITKENLEDVLDDEAVYNKILPYLAF